MRAYVLRDARLARHAGRFVWLSIDTENAANAAFLARYPVDTWPTFLVLGQHDGKPLLRWVGSATAAQLDDLLASVERTPAPSRGGQRAGEALARADRANAEGRVDEAIAGYREASQLGGARWAGRPRAVESLVLAEGVAGRLEECATTARREAPRLPRGSAFANVVGAGLACATSAPPDASWRERAISALEPLARTAVALPGVLADDRAGIYDALVEAR